jgi:hypothetical protein
MPDYHAKIKALRAKAADPTVTPEESKILTEKAAELEKKYGKVSSPSGDYTVVTGTRYYTDMGDVLDLLRRQYQWNRPPAEEDIVEEKYRNEPEDEDYGYDMFEGEDW